MQPPSTRFSTDVALTLGVRLGSAVLLVFFRFFLAVFLGPAGQGQYYVFLQSALLFAMIWSMGLGHSAIYFTNKLKLESDRRKIPLGTYHLSFLIATLFTLGSYFVLQKNLFGLGDKVPDEFLLLVLLGALILTLYHNGQSVLLAIHRNRLYVLLAFVTAILQVVVFLLFMSVGIQGPRSAMGAYCVAVALVVLAGYVSTVTTTGTEPALFGPEMKARLRFGVQAALSSVLSVLIYRIDFFLVARMLGDTSSGQYSVAEMMSEVIWFIPDAIATMLLPRMARLDSADERREGVAVIRHSLWITLAASVILPAAVFIFVSTLGNAYHSSFLPFVLLLPGIWTMSIGKVAFSLLIVRKDLFFANGCLLATLLLNGILTFFTIPHWGLHGAAASSSIALTVGSALVLGRYLRISGASLKSATILQKTDILEFRKILARVPLFGKK